LRIEEVSADDNDTIEEDDFLLTKR